MVDSRIEALQWESVQIDSIERTNIGLLFLYHDIIGVILLAVLRYDLIGDGGEATLLGGGSRSRCSIGSDSLEGRHGSTRRQRDTVGEKGRQEAINADIVGTYVAKQSRRTQRADIDSQSVALFGITIGGCYLNEHNKMCVVLLEQRRMNQCVRFGCNSRDSRQVGRSKLVGERGFVELGKWRTVYING